MDKLPKVYVNPIDKNIDNEQKTFASFDKRSLNNEKRISVRNIDEILNSNHHIYRTVVRVTTISDVIICKIVGRTNNEIITIDNTRIPISNIINIEVI